jgi:tetratricopeptide (TPR) repeat protein
LKPPTRVSRPSLMEPLPPTPETIPLVFGIAGAVLAHYAGVAVPLGALAGLGAGFGVYELMRRVPWAGLRRFAILPWEFNVRGLRARSKGDLEGAARHFASGLALHPRNAALLYNAACIASLQGRTEEARELLAGAAVRDPRAHRWARDDEDLAGTMAAWPANAPSA